MVEAIMPSFGPGISGGDHNLSLDRASVVIQRTPDQSLAIAKMSRDLDTYEREFKNEDVINPWLMKAVKDVQVRNKLTGILETVDTLVSLDGESVQDITDEKEKGGRVWQSTHERAKILTTMRQGEVAIWVSPGEEMVENTGKNSRIYRAKMREKGIVEMTAYTVGGREEELWQILDKLTGKKHDRNNGSVLSVTARFSSDEKEITHKVVFQAYSQSLRVEDRKKHEPYIRKFASELSVSDEARFEQIERRQKQYEMEMRELVLREKDAVCAFGIIAQSLTAMPKVMEAVSWETQLGSISKELNSNMNDKSKEIILLLQGALIEISRQVIAISDNKPHAHDLTVGTLENSEQGIWVRGKFREKISDSNTVTLTLQESSVRFLGNKKEPEHLEEKTIGEHKDNEVLQDQYLSDSDKALITWSSFVVFFISLEEQQQRSQLDISSDRISAIDEELVEDTIRLADQDDEIARSLDGSFISFDKEGTDEFISNALTESELVISLKRVFEMIYGSNNEDKIVNKLELGVDMESGVFSQAEKSMVYLGKKLIEYLGETTREDAIKVKNKNILPPSPFRRLKLLLTVYSDEDLEEDSKKIISVFIYHEISQMVKNKVLEGSSVARLIDRQMNNLKDYREDYELMYIVLKRQMLHFFQSKLAEGGILFPLSSRGQKKEESPTFEILRLPRLIGVAQDGAHGIMPRLQLDWHTFERLPRHFSANIKQHGKNNYRKKNGNIKIFPHSGIIYQYRPLVNYQ